MLEPQDQDHDPAAPIDTIEAYYAANEIAYQRHDEEIVATVKAGWTSYELRALWRDEDSALQLLAFFDVKAPEDRRPALYEALALVNEQVWMGHFELWSTTGTLLYRNAALVPADDEGEGTLSLSAAELLIESAVDECERFYPVFQFVLWGGKTAPDALAAALVDTHGEA